jgi:hypothetical protein
MRRCWRCLARIPDGELCEDCSITGDHRELVTGAHLRRAVRRGQRRVLAVVAIVVALALAATWLLA